VTIPEALAAEIDLDQERPGRSRDDLVAELMATRPSSEDLVVCHGDLSLPNVVFDPDTYAVAGLVDAGRLGVADRWVDLAIATRSMTSRLNAQYGPGTMERFLARYGIPFDRAKCDFYRLMDEFA
jgi:kanamycin kinase